MLQAYGTLKRSVDRPMLSLEIEHAHNTQYQRIESKLSAGRYETLRKLQTYVDESDKPYNGIAMLSGPVGSGKSNVAAFLQKMLREGYRVVPNPSTKLPQFTKTVSLNGRRGATWSNPIVISWFGPASRSLSTTRGVLQYLLESIAIALSGVVYKPALAGLKSSDIVPPADPAKLAPVPELYNQLKLKFKSLCTYMDRFFPTNKVLDGLAQRLGSRVWGLCD
jgi:hypothetical protein